MEDDVLLNRLVVADFKVFMAILLISCLYAMLGYLQ